MYAKGRILSKISDKLWEQGYEKTEEIKYAETHWPVYQEYWLYGKKGFRYMWAPEVRAGSANGSVNGQVRAINPLTPEYADLFLKFARWFDKYKMNKGAKNEFGLGPFLDTEHNGRAALAWVHEYGVLGLGTNPDESYAVFGGISSHSTEIAAEKLGMPHISHPGVRAYKKSPRGGKHETVDDFVSEAYQANTMLKLYEAATAPAVDISNIARFMSKKRDLDFYLPAKYRELPKTEREKWAENADDARYWALSVIEETVTEKIENDIYPILTGEPGSYKEGWGFKSLLGAMWLQMRNFMLSEDNTCLRCGELFPKTRRDRVYCGDECSARTRAAKSYEREKQRAKEKREATKKKLQG